MSAFIVCSDCSSATNARIRITGTARDHLSPSTTETKSGATTIMPSSAGIVTAAIRRIVLIQTAATRSLSSCIRANAGNITCWIGPAIWLNGIRMMLYATAYDADRRGAEKPPDQDPVGAPRCVVEESLREHLAAEAAQRSSGSRIEKRSSRPPLHKRPDEDAADRDAVSCCPMIAHAPAPPSARPMPTTAPHRVAAI